MTKKPHSPSAEPETGTVRLSNEGPFWFVFSALITAGLLLKAAWIAEDAYITFRTVDNFVHGYGLTWNPAERVQVFTHPLWMLCVAVPYFFTREIIVTVSLLSIALTMGAIVLLGRTAHSWRTALVALAALISSKAFVDYGASGLETPLTYFLLALFFLVYFGGENKPNQLFRLTFVASLVSLNRLDTILLTLPCLLHVLYQARTQQRQSIAKMSEQFALGFCPLIVWLGFSLLYYGFLFPNTAYAKLATGIPRALLVQQGLYYLMNSLTEDVVTLTAIASVAGLTFMRGVRNDKFVLAGLLLYLLYVVYVGGDFMSGRFLAPPLFAAAVLLARVRWENGAAWLAVAAFILLGLTAPRPTLFYNDQYQGPFEDHRGVADERGYYYQATGLLRQHRGKVEPEHAFVAQGKQARANSPKVVVMGNVGMFGYYAGPNVHIIDPAGLTDPLIARQPIPNVRNWRIGHFLREVPPGYVETIQSGKNKIADPNLRRFYEKLAIITRGPLFAPSRLLDIIKLNLD